jgi:hypothetical protein
MTTLQTKLNPIARRTFVGSLVAGCGFLVGFRKPEPHQIEQKQANYHHATELGADDVFKDWHSRARAPIWFSHLPELSLLIEAIRRNEPLYGPYTRWGKHAIRRITPLALFHIEPELDEFDDPEGAYPDVIDIGPTYLQAWDHDHQAARTFQAEYFKPRYTAPWMQAYAEETNPNNWQSTLKQTQSELHSQGIAPVPLRSLS